jgi:hypothetical protein
VGGGERGGPGGDGGRGGHGGGGSGGVSVGVFRGGISAPDVQEPVFAVAGGGPGGPSPGNPGAAGASADML